MDLGSIFSQSTFYSTCYEGLVFSLLALGVYLTFRVLAFPDLSVDGTFALGGIVVGVLIAKHSMNPFAATVVAMAAGFCAGMVTGILNAKLRIPALLAGILMMFGLYSVNIMINGGSANRPLLRDRTIFDITEDWFGIDGIKLSIITVLIIVVAVFLFLNWFLRTDLGLALRATGDNEQMVRSLGMDTDKSIILTCALSNALVSLSGAVIAQNQGFADAGMGWGKIVIGLAIVIIGAALIRQRGIASILLACIVGSFLYRFIYIATLEMDWLEPYHFYGVTVALVIVLLSLPYLKKRIRGEWIPPATRW